MSYIDGQGTTLGKGDGASPENFTLITQITSLSIPSAERSQRETTDLDATARTYKSGLRDFTDINVSLEWDERLATHAGLRTDFDANTERNWQITDAGSPTKVYSFTGSITRLDIDPVTPDSITNATMVVKPSGPVVVA